MEEALNTILNALAICLAIVTIVIAGALSIGIGRLILVWFGVMN